MRQWVIHQGMYPATVPGARMRKMAVVTMAEMRRMRPSFGSGAMGIV